jgi:hypothetical protein
METAIEFDTARSGEWIRKILVSTQAIPRALNATSRDYARCSIPRQLALASQPKE